jgi:energy-coupling factor transport system permease protein
VSAIGLRRPLTYRPVASPLHAAGGPVAAAYGAALATAALIVWSPILLGALLVAVVLAAAGAGVAGPLARFAARLMLPLLVLSVAVNGLVDRGGLTVLARLGEWGVLGQVDVTLEAVVYGVVFALRLLVVTLACLLIVCAANPDELMRALRRVSPRSALTAAIGTRLLGVLAGDAQRLAEAQRCRPDGGVSGTRGRLAVLRATVAGALDRSLDVAAVLEMRGYGARRARGPGLPLSRHDIAFMLAALGTLAVAIVAQASGMARFETFPLLSMRAGAGALSVAGLLIVLALAPFLDRRGIER